MSKKRLYCHIEQLMTLAGAVKKNGRNIEASDLGVIRNGAIAVDGDRIAWVGRERQVPKVFGDYKRISMKGHNVYPGFVDCHTHLIFAGDRRSEFELRNKGVSYQQIAEQGGGIQSTVKATRKASLNALVTSGQKRVEACMTQGVTTVEVKSGYGLNEKSELKILRAIKELKKIRVIPTFLGAHGIPKESASEASYLKSLERTLIKIQKEDLSSRVDIFIEKGYFSVKGARPYLKTAQALGFDITVHADQLSRCRAAMLAVDLKAKSADHVICLSKAELAKLASSETTAVLLPAADFYIHCSYPDARGLLDRGGRCALATDFNPGSSPTQSLGLVGLLARLKMKMSLPEVFVGLTLAGAFALGRENNFGSLVKGRYADFFSSKEKWENFFYDGQNPPVEGVWCQGKKVR